MSFYFSALCIIFRLVNEKSVALFDCPVSTWGIFQFTREVSIKFDMKSFSVTSLLVLTSLISFFLSESISTVVVKSPISFLFHQLQFEQLLLVYLQVEPFTYLQCNRCSFPTCCRNWDIFGSQVYSQNNLEWRSGLFSPILLFWYTLLMSPEPTLTLFVDLDFRKSFNFLSS